MTTLPVDPFTFPSAQSALVGPDGKRITPPWYRVLVTLFNRAQTSQRYSGEMVAWPQTATIPTGFLRCNGQAVSRTTYASLFAASSNGSTPFGPGDGSTTFTVPNITSSPGGGIFWIIKT